MGIFSFKNRKYNCRFTGKCGDRYRFIFYSITSEVLERAQIVSQIPDRTYVVSVIDQEFAKEIMAELGFK